MCITSPDPIEHNLRRLLGASRLQVLFIINSSYWIFTKTKAAAFSNAVYTSCNRVFYWCPGKRLISTFSFSFINSFFKSFVVTLLWYNILFILKMLPWYYLVLRTKILYFIKKRKKNVVEEESSLWVGINFLVYFNIFVYLLILFLYKIQSEGKRNILQVAYSQVRLAILLLCVYILNRVG